MSVEWRRLSNEGEVSEVRIKLYVLTPAIESWILNDCDSRLGVHENRYFLMDTKLRKELV